MVEDDKVTINFGDVQIDASDFKIENNKSYPQNISRPSTHVKYTWELSDESAALFKKIIIKKYGENIKRCMACEYCTIIIDDTGAFKDLKCKLGTGKLSMISGDTCLLPYGG